MTQHQFTDDRLAGLYDRFYPPEQRADFAFYLPLIMGSQSVLDVGCGTGALLRMARDAGHAGRLVGLDPAAGMLNQARERSDIEWVHGDLSTTGWQQEFDLAVMTGHAFQELLEDAAIRTALTAIRTALVDGGRFAFETRNPLDRAWERWPSQYSGEATDVEGNLVRCEYQVEVADDERIVTSTSTFTSSGWERAEVSRGSLRFVDAETLDALLRDAGFVIETQFGNWSRSPLTDESPEIITIAQKR
jgi:ubiquinone/menaquinone biosynthesis C-methylase UbiE